MGQGERRAWAYEHWLSIPRLRGKEDFQAHLGAGLTNYLDNISLVGRTRVDLSLVEIHALAGGTFFPNITSLGKIAAEAARPEKTVVGFGLGRSFATSPFASGRLLVSYFQTFPGKTKYVDIGVGGSNQIDDETGWAMAIDTHLLLSASGKPTHLLIFVESSRNLGRNYVGSRVGGFLKTVYLPSGVDTVGTHDHLVFSLGPFVEKNGILGQWRLEVPIRVWIDREISPSGNPHRPPQYPIELSPAVTLSWFTYF